MCDTVVVVDSDQGRVFFAKNSDREPDEPQVLVWQPRRIHAEDEWVQCTHVRIPQVRETYAVLLSKPTWMWGAEMGTNEFGVTIGNEAVFTNQPYNRTGLTGMDLIRLALERSTSAKHACEVIIQLIETYGQGGNCGYRKTIYYHNSFLIADPQEAYLLETANQQYQVEKVTHICVISNGLTIKEFKDRYSDKIKSYFTQCEKRKKAIELFLSRNKPDLSTLMQILRLHSNQQNYPNYHWFYGGMDSPCMHAGGIFLNYQTTASWISELHPTHQSHWVTATSTPCISLFKPVNVTNPLSEQFCDDNFTLRESFWWSHEKFQRLVMKNPQQTYPLFIDERDKIEQNWINSPPDPESAFETHQRYLQQWTEKLLQTDIVDTRPFYTRWYYPSQTQTSPL